MKRYALEPNSALNIYNTNWDMGELYIVEINRFCRYNAMQVYII